MEIKLDPDKLVSSEASSSGSTGYKILYFLGGHSTLIRSNMID